MAALVVQSRFAGLKIEDDDYSSSSESKNKKTKPSAAKKPEPAKKTKTNTATKTQNAPKKKKNKQPAANSEQWEQWKQKDEQLVDGHYEDELQQAILLSKLDYEEKKDVYKAMKKEAEQEKKQSDLAAKNNKKQKKKNVMSLDQFNDMVTTGEEPKSYQEDERTKQTPEHKSPDRDTEFFERVKDEAKNELLKDKIIDRVRNRKNVSHEVVTRSQFADALERKEQEITALKEEVTSLKEELLTVKSRNRKLCNILGQGEMKDKASVLIEVERLRNVQAELTAEIETLNSELQKERSRNQESNPRARDKKKRTASEKEK
ncbi:G kinase-anchoring protein 1-like isoform X2 [Phthorimaea operculella]|nr:G kinase-anchoring protein 1-like isoform X2 [Phthorimaea operculella]